MKVPRSTKPNQKRRYFIRMLLAALLTTTMIVTGGFGAFSDNPLTEAFQVVIGESFPAELVNLFNAYMANLSAPQIPPVADSESDGDSQLDPVGVILSFFDTVSASTANEPSFIDATITALAQTQTQVVVIQSRTATITPVQTHIQTAIPSVTFTLPPTATQSPIPTWTFQPIYFPPTATEKSEQIPVPTLTFTPTNTPTTVPNHLTLYEGIITTGNIGPRSSADALCAANLPAGFSKYRAFIGYSTADSIANMVSNYGMPTNLPIQSVTNVVLANDWTDLMDGSISVSLSSANVTNEFWWSGAQDGNGNFITGTTPSCFDWTSSSGSDAGRWGNMLQTNSTWLSATNAGCGDPLAVLCIAY